MFGIANVLLRFVAIVSHFLLNSVLGGDLICCYGLDYISQCASVTISTLGWSMHNNLAT